MAEKLTEQQKAAVENRGGELLVSAAAGSGKTKVLVERLLRYVTDPVEPANIDDFLIITYTKAAAAELRGKIAKALTERIAQDPSNQRLQLQFQRLYLAKISTVHSFCSDIIREYSYLLDISSDFRMIEEKESEPLRQQLVEKMLDAAYDQIGTDSDLQCFVDTQGVGRNDRQVPELILNVYDSAKCHMDPENWLQKCVKDSDVCNVNDPLQTIWGVYLKNQLFNSIDLHTKAMDKMARICDESFGLAKMAEFLRDIIFQLQSIRASDTWDEIHRLRNVDFHNLTCLNRVKKDKEVYEKAKAVREACKADIESYLRAFGNNSAQVVSDLDQTLPAVRGLVNLVRKFSEIYDKAKRGLHIVDFSDLEHKALDLLLGKSRSGITVTAREIGNRFREIMVDEYQDSNEVQDAIFGALTSNRNNLFMVGDVKQSIYQFRLADPGIFLDKYSRYYHYEKAEAGQGRKIVLSKNFRSCDAVINAVNSVFRACMTESVGGLDYGDAEALCAGREYTAIPEKEVELHVISTSSDVYAEEAEFVAERIIKLLDGTHMVRDGENLRPIIQDDIVILLRSPKTSGWDFHYALQKRGLNTVSSNSDDLLEAEEVDWLRSFLQTINNPHQDIPLIATLAGPAFGFSADDLAIIRSSKMGCSYYEALRSCKLSKANEFLTILDKLRNDVKTHSLPELIESIFRYTHADSIYAAMYDGADRSANLQEFYQFVVKFQANGKNDLQQLLNYLQQSEEKGLESERENSIKGCIQILSIHKSKGLEYPVVFLSGLSRAFNMTSARGNILCDQHLGLGLSCVDNKNRIRYPSLSKFAISSKIRKDSISEELRVLYVAMTRPKDRLIMTFAQSKAHEKIAKITARMDVSEPELITGEVGNPGTWILYSALQRTEAGDLFAVCGKPAETYVSEIPWHITFSESLPVEHDDTLPEFDEKPQLPAYAAPDLRESLSYRYGHQAATVTPSKQTATQSKGRQKDQEVSENAEKPKSPDWRWRKPKFIQVESGGRTKGNAMHAAMQHIRFEACISADAVGCEIERMVTDGFISEEHAALIDRNRIFAFFRTELGSKLRESNHVLREFKFSILWNADANEPMLKDERVLLQGVVDCALIEPDGITIIDFKTDRVSSDTFQDTVEKYRGQIETYASALSRIYELPVKAKALYLFHIQKFAWL